MRKDTTSEESKGRKNAGVYAHSDFATYYLIKVLYVIDLTFAHQLYTLTPYKKKKDQVQNRFLLFTFFDTMELLCSTFRIGI